MVKRKSPRRPSARPSGRGLSRPRDSGGIQGDPSPRRAAGAESYWLYGAHAVLEALANPRRRRLRLLVSAEAMRRQGAALEPKFGDRGGDGGGWPPVEAASREAIARVLPEDAVHQGLALFVDPLAQPPLGDLLAFLLADGSEAEAQAQGPRPVVLVLDQVTDPHNVGAVLRSAAAFGAGAVITTWRNAPPESGALGKAASGALERVPYLRVSNLARALESLKQAGFWRLGLAGEATETLAETDPGGAVAVVLGAEGAGLRRLTREACDFLVRLPTAEAFRTLNVSTAAAVTLYELLGRRA